jgi:hypothetical protein
LIFRRYNKDHEPSRRERPERPERPVRQERSERPREQSNGGRQERSERPREQSNGGRQDRPARQYDVRDARPVRQERSDRPREQSNVRDARPVSVRNRDPWPSQEQIQAQPRSSQPRNVPRVIVEPTYQGQEQGDRYTTPCRKLFVKGLPAEHAQDLLNEVFTDEPVEGMAINVRGDYATAIVYLSDGDRGRKLIEQSYASKGLACGDNTVTIFRFNNVVQPAQSA